MQTSTVMVVCVLTVYIVVLQDLGYDQYSVPHFHNTLETLNLLEKVLIYKPDFILHYTPKVVSVHAHKK